MISIKKWPAAGGWHWRTSWAKGRRLPGVARDVVLLLSLLSSPLCSLFTSLKVRIDSIVLCSSTFQLHHINYTSKSITMHASALLPFLVAVASARNLEKRQSTTSAAAPEGTPVRLEDTVNSLCQPNYQTWQTGTLDEKRAAGLDQYSDVESLSLSFSASPFPCEKVWYYLASCTDSFIPRNSQNKPYDPTQAKESSDDIEAERDCICSADSGAKGKGDYFAMIRACTDCGALHGYAEGEYTTYKREQAAWSEARFCNETVPEKNFFGIQNSNEFEENGSNPGPPQQGETDQAEGKTEVGLYYTSTVKQETGSMTAMAQPTEKGEGSGGDGAAAATTAGGAAASGTAAPGAGNELKIGGGLMIAAMGAVFILS